MFISTHSGDYSFHCDIFGHGVSLLNTFPAKLLSYLSSVNEDEAEKMSGQVGKWQEIPGLFEEFCRDGSS